MMTALMVLAELLIDLSDEDQPKQKTHRRDESAAGSISATQVMELPECKTILHKTPPKRRPKPPS